MPKNPLFHAPKIDIDTSGMSPAGHKGGLTRCSKDPECLGWPDDGKAFSGEGLMQPRNFIYHFLRRSPDL